MTARTIVNVRLAEAGVTRLDRLADDAAAELGTEVTRSDVIRAAFAIALQSEDRLRETTVQLKRAEAQRL